MLLVTWVPRGPGLVGTVAVDAAVAFPPTTPGCRGGPLLTQSFAGGVGSPVWRPSLPTPKNRLNHLGLRCFVMAAISGFKAFPKLLETICLSGFPPLGTWVQPKSRRLPWASRGRPPSLLCLSLVCSHCPMLFPLWVKPLPASKAFPT